MATRYFEFTGDDAQRGVVGSSKFWEVRFPPFCRHGFMRLVPRFGGTLTRRRWVFCNRSLNTYVSCCSGA